MAEKSNSSYIKPDTEEAEAYLGIFQLSQF